MPMKPYVTKVGVSSEIVDFTSCSPTWRMTSIIAPCERWGTLPTGFSVLPAHAELNADRIAKELPLFARSAGALVKLRHIKRLSTRWPCVVTALLGHRLEWPSPERVYVIEIKAACPRRHNDVFLHFASVSRGPPGRVRSVRCLGRLVVRKRRGSDLGRATRAGPVQGNLRGRECRPYCQAGLALRERRVQVRIEQQHHANWRFAVWELVRKHAPRRREHLWTEYRPRDQREG